MIWEIPDLAVLAFLGLVLAGVVVTWLMLWLMWVEIGKLRAVRHKDKEAISNQGALIEQLVADQQRAQSMAYQQIEDQKRELAWARRLIDELREQARDLKGPRPG